MEPTNLRIRIGHGVDLHQLEPGKRCIIGGIEIPSPVGSVAHSDGDVLIHALIDAIQGAQGEPDIGVKFPNTDKKYLGVSSLFLLQTIWSETKQRGFSLINADICVVCQEPKLQPHTVEMKDVLARALEVSSQQIGIKATTAEKLGSLGRGEGIFASATVLLQRV